MDAARGLVCSLLSLSSVLGVQVLAQQAVPTDVTIEGHIYEPARLSPTDARLAALNVPTGFSVQRAAEGLDNPRILAVGPAGLYVTQRKPGNVVLLRDLDGDGLFDVQRIVLRLPQAHGIAIRNHEIYLTDVKQIYSGAIRNDGSIDQLRVIARGLPDGGQHPNRTLGFSPEGDLFVTVGSTCNECRETNPENATILKVPLRDPGAPREIFASGLRNTIGFGWHPVSARLFGMDHGIDWLGDNEQSEEMNEIRHQRYGWPYVYDEDQFNPHSEPQNLTLEQWAALSEEPVGLYTPHSAPMQLAFYTANVFPSEYRNDAFVSMRGSWNRKPPSGYEVVRARFTSSGEFNAFEPFLTGFLEAQPDGSFGYFARPVGSAVDRTGALLLSDDTNNILYRVSYGPAVASAPSQQLTAQIFSDVPSSIQLRSTAIAPEGAIPRRYTNYGADVSPPLRWTGVPSGARSLVLLVEDPDAIAPLPFVHWAAVNISADATALKENIPKAFQSRGSSLQQGSTSITTTGYFGPRPPPGDPAHHYHFQIFALDTRLNLPPGFNRQALLKAMRGHVLAKGTFVGLYAEPNALPSASNPSQ